MVQEFGGEKVAAFVPLPLPPSNPALDLTKEISTALRQAEEGLGKLEVAGEMVPSLKWFIYAFVRKEAVISSQIEGTEASLVDLLEYEANPSIGSPADDVLEVCNYLDAVTFARKELRRPKGLPLSICLLNEAHRRLLSGVRGADKHPGEVRRSQNWIGGTRPGNAVFVPAPPEEVPALLGALEKYLHAESELHPLLRIGLLHVQFETIHPYLDGNGRIGRLLITLLLEHWKLLSSPMLYLSLYFKRHRSEYYRLLSEVRKSGDWEAWLLYFLEGVASTSKEALESARALHALVGKDRERLLSAGGSSVIAIRLFEILPEHPIVSVPLVVKLLRTTKPTAAKAVAILEKLRILKETTGRRRDRAFLYSKYLELLRVGTEIT